eukprot:7561803-Lingulodinium_polyedra.AAC.1
MQRCPAASRLPRSLAPACTGARYLELAASARTSAEAPLQAYASEAPLCAGDTATAGCAASGLAHLVNCILSLLCLPPLPPQP